MRYKDKDGNWKELSIKASDTLPIGSIIPFGGTEAPTNWLICDGSMLNREAYPELFNAIGTSFGTDGPGNFYIPDLRGRVIVGQDTSDADFGIGSIGGEKTHTLTIEEMPKHAHNTGKSWAADNDGAWGVTSSDVTYSYSTTWEGTAYSGGSQPHNILQPYTVTNYIIKAKQSVGVVGNVVNEKTTSDKDTYSCDYINNKLNDEDVSSQITLDDGYTKTINFAIKQNNIIHINMVVDFTATTVVNNKIGNHTFNLKKDCILPIFAYGDGYTGGFGTIAFYTDGRIYLIAYSGSGNHIKQVTCNGAIYQI